MKFKARVKKGSGRGKKLGFPTLNLDYSPEFSFGVYGADVFIDNEKFKAALFYGPRKMFHEPEPSLEVHLIGTSRSGDCVGREVEVILGEKIRDVEKYNSEEELKSAIAKDVEKIRSKHLL